MGILEFIVECGGLLPLIYAIPDEPTIMVRVVMRKGAAAVLAFVAAAAAVLIMLPEPPPVQPDPPPPAAPFDDPSEALVLRVDGALDELAVWIVHLSHGQALDAFAPDFRGATVFDRPADAPSARYADAGVDRFDLTADASPPADRLAACFARFDRIDDVDVSIKAVESVEPPVLVLGWRMRGGAVEIRDRQRVTFGADMRIVSAERIEGWMLRAARPAFRDVTAEAGIDLPVGLPCMDPRFFDPDEGPAPSCHGCSYRTPFLQLGGVAAGDYDADGRPDLFVPGPGGARLLHNEGVTFRDVTNRSGLMTHRGFGAGAIWFEADGDGDLDLLMTAICCRPERPCFSGAVTLFRNNGNGTFTDVTERAGLASHGAAFSASAGDVDADGDLDVYVAFYGGTKLDQRLFTYGPGVESYISARNGEANRLFINDGKGVFVECAAEFGADDTGWGLACVMTDLDGDARPDIYVANDFGDNVLLLNRGGRFERAAGAEDPGFGMGVTVADLDGDTQLDLYISNMYSTAGGRVLKGAAARLQKARQGNSLLRAAGGGRFEDIGDAAGVRGAGWAWGSAAVDAFHAGRQDLYVANGFLTGLGTADL